jgi:hypothetical protein
MFWSRLLNKKTAGNGLRLLASSHRSDAASSAAGGQAKEVFAGPLTHAKVCKAGHLHGANNNKAGANVNPSILHC